MKKLFFLFFILFASMDSSAIGLSENNAFAGVKSQAKSRGVLLAESKSQGNRKQLHEKEARVETETITSSIVGLVSGFFSRIFSLFLTDYLSFHVEGGLPEKC